VGVAEGEAVGSGLLLLSQPAIIVPNVIATASTYVIVDFLRLFKDSTSPELGKRYQNDPYFFASRR